LGRREYGMSFILKVQIEYSLLMVTINYHALDLKFMAPLMHTRDTSSGVMLVFQIELPYQLTSNISDFFEQHCICPS